MRVLTRGDWAFLALLFAFSFIPSVVGLLRLPELMGGPALVPPNARAVIDPVPISLHILGSSLFCLAGAVQFLPRLRQHRPRLHRSLGRVVATAGVLSALTGLWMTLAYPFPEALQGPLLFWVRIAMSLAMVGVLVWAILAIRARKILAHRAAMLRAYAIGQGAATQTVLFLLTMAVTGEELLYLPRDILMTLAWGINLIVAEILIRWPKSRATAAPATVI